MYDPRRPHPTLKHPLLRYLPKDLKWLLDHRILILWDPKTLGMNSGQLKLPDTLQKLRGGICIFHVWFFFFPWKYKHNQNGQKEGLLLYQKTVSTICSKTVDPNCKKLVMKPSTKKIVSQCNLSFPTWISLFSHLIHLSNLLRAGELNFRDCSNNKDLKL